MKTTKEFICFKTFKHNYIYDRNSHSVAMINSSDYDKFYDYVDEKLDENEFDAFVQKYRNIGLLNPIDIEEIRHPKSDYIEHMLDNRCTQLVLQVTQRCNLRCSYCIYGGKYKNRSHNSKDMSFELAKKSIDFFIERTTETPYVVFSFYGGEPLLNFDLVKDCVKYIQGKFKGKQYLFNLSTNATLLNDEKVDFLVENDFSILISLDGDKQEHDFNRKLASGEGSFDIIMNNIQKIREKYPEYVKTKIVFNAVISPKERNACVEDFFDSEAVLEDTNIMFNQLNTIGNLEEIDIEENFIIKRRFEYIKMLMFLIGKVEEKDVSRLVIETSKDIEKLYRELKRPTYLAKINHHSGPCMPGCSRLFVSVDGEFFPCERVPELDYCKIGNIEQGFDIENVSKILNIGKLSEEECKNCWAINICSVCINQLDVDGDLKTENKTEMCEKMKILCLNNLYEVTVLNEFGYKLPLERE